jgi:hypothetical protein
MRCEVLKEEYLILSIIFQVSPLEPKADFGITTSRHFSGTGPVPCEKIGYGFKQHGAKVAVPVPGKLRP